MRREGTGARLSGILGLLPLIGALGGVGAVAGIPSATAAAGGPASPSAADRPLRIREGPIPTALPDRALCAAPVGLSRLDDPTRVEMTPTRRATGARGAYTLRFDSSPYGVAVSSAGSYRYRVEVSVEGLRKRESRSYVVWAATPDLDRHERLGVVENGSAISGTVDWNKFMIFVTAERSPDPESWSQEIVLTARSPSGRMHTMAGHGPFSGEPCLDPRN